MNFMITILGWALWNWAAFSIEKDTYDDAAKDMPLREYRKRNWDGWIGSLLCVPLLLWIGFRQMSIDPFAELLVGHKIGWNDLYLLGSGFAWEALIFGIKKAKSFFKKRASEL